MVSGEAGKWWANYLIMSDEILKAKGVFSRFQDKPFRPGQEEAIRFVTESDKKVVVIWGPTGSGKSLIGTVSGALSGRFAYLCSTKQLQRQLTYDFPEARFMMGRNNFACNLEPDTRTADLCTHTKQTPCRLKGVCNYELHKEAVLEHPYQILNYHYLLSEANYVGRFADYPIMICDEADMLEGLLTQFIELRLTQSKLRTLNLSPPQYKTSTAKNGIASWQAWAKDEAYTKVSDRVWELFQSIQGFYRNSELTDAQLATIREYKSLKNLEAKLNIFSQHMDDTWIFQEQNNNGYVKGWIFQPTWLSSELSEQYFFRHADKFVLMSATFPPIPVLAEMLGLSTGDIDCMELPSAFPVSNRSVILNPVADMSYKTFDDELPKLLSEIQRIVDSHPSEKGLIHTVSWKLNSEIMNLNHPRLVSHASYNKDEALKEFMESDNLVFVSPSSTRGVDLPDDLCRFIIIPKAPFQSLGDKLVSSRVYGSGLGKFWYRAICAQDLVQASGRAVRHKDDWCTTYLLDRQTERLIVDNQSLFPRYWMDAVDYA